MELPSELPILPLKNAVVYPHMVIPLHISQERSLRLVESVLGGDKLLGLVAQRDAEQDEPPPDALYDVGTAGVIHKMLKMPDGSTSILVQGLVRVQIGPYGQETPFLAARIAQLVDVFEDTPELRALASSVSGQFQKLVQSTPQLPDELAVAALNADSPGILADLVVSNLNLSLEERQALLENRSVHDRLQQLSTLLARELEVVDLRNKIESDVRDQMGKVQREHILREQLKAIQRELGEEDERQREVDELRQQVTDAGMPEEIEKVALKELDRLGSMPPGAAEHSVIRTYLDWLITLPWAVRTEDNLNLGGARQIHDEDHYDLDQIKERILEYLAVRRLNPKMKGPILCFVGPPGVGKTSLGRSIARALGRKFVRMSLGGVRDEAEIRGHRRTYVGALPGRVIQGLRDAGSMNPVFMLDEVDELGMDFRGDPSSALLEVLDPEQNFSFSDHYLEVQVDLSQVMFITTANFLDPIPPALRDRMEVVELVGYTEAEKCHIARRHLLTRQLAENGITAEGRDPERRRAWGHHPQLHPRGRGSQPGTGDRYRLPEGGAGRSGDRFPKTQACTPDHGAQPARVPGSGAVRGAGACPHRSSRRGHRAGGHRVWGGRSSSSSPR